MSEQKRSPLQFVLNIESVRLANWFIRVTFKATASIIALIARLVAVVVLVGVRRRRRRNRYLR